jgi:hypothetical protein
MSAPAAKSFFEHQQLARRNSRVMVALFLLAVVAVVAAVVAVVATAYAASLPGVSGGELVPWRARLQAVPPGLYALAALGTAGMILLVSTVNVARLASGGPAVAKMVGARPVAGGTQDPLERRLLNSAIALPVVRVVSRTQPLREEIEVVRRFDARVDRLWERLSDRFALAVRRDARYLNWKYAEPPHVRYTSALLRRGDDVDGYVIYRHFHEPQGRVTQIVDLLADPADERGIKTLARWVDREARINDSDKIRCHVTHASFRRVLRRSGYFVVKSGIDLTVKVNAVPVPKGLYDSVDEWHFTLGDGELDH